MLHWETVNDLLKHSLSELMDNRLFDDFRLVGGTALSLHIGHRLSIDIDLFTDAPYGSIDFKTIEHYLQATFPYVEGDFGGNPVFGKSYLIGNTNNDHIKLDIYYSQEPFLFEPVVTEGIRLASIDEILSMKVDVIMRGGRKKDFWDLHAFIEKYSLNQFIELHRKRHEWTHDSNKIRTNLTRFEYADTDFDPHCLLGKHWEFIKEDLEEFVSKSL